MTRARPMAPKERRRALIDATLPLLLTHGPHLTTRRIAEAAGVAEGTIFRVFDSKHDLIDAAVADALSPERLDDRLRRATADATDLLELATALVGALQSHSIELRQLFGSCPQREGSDHSRHRTEHAAAHRHTIGILTELLAPYADKLTLPVRSAAASLMALSFGSTFALSEGDYLPPPDAVARTLLFGIAKEH